MSTDAPYILQTMPTIGRLPEVNEWMKLQKAVNGQREVLHSAYGGLWVIDDPINSPSYFASGGAGLQLAEEVPYSKNFIIKITKVGLKKKKKSS